jgi:NAD(P) transhydrogenase subunit alpha
MDRLCSPAAASSLYSVGPEAPLAAPTSARAIHSRVRLKRPVDTLAFTVDAVRVGVPRETAPGERRVALVPEAVSRFGDSGIQVVVEPGAGEAAWFTDDAYRDAGAELGDPWSVDVVAKVQKPIGEEVAKLREGSVLIGFLQPLSDPEGVDLLASRGVTAFAMESIPRITRAQPMDALSSQATVSGYKAVLLAADRLPKFFPMLMTAAGTVRPAKVLVLGAGVAGLQAIATAHRLGAVVSAFDVRPVVKEQVESLGATFLDLGVLGEETEAGYARELTETEQRRQQEALDDKIPDFDVVITTALVPGRPAPRLIPAAAVKGMRPGSVVVDLAAEAGGNCELTEPDEEVEREGVRIIGYTNLPSTMPQHASQLYARNVSALLQHLAPQGELVLDFEDEITAGACVTRRKEVAA